MLRVRIRSKFSLICQRFCLERAQQLISNDGLQIPLPFMVQYGLHPGSEVTVELDDDVIRIVPKLPDQTDIENRK